MLADGTMLSELIDYERREVDLRVLSDPQLYQLELDRLFAKQWIMVGHETEIPNSGDFVLRTIGEDNVIVTRLENGKIAISLNVCPHRGMQVCRSEAGNASKFRCAYHAWVFDTDGSFLAAPFEREMYDDALVKDRANLGLTQARVDTIGGVIFGNFDQSAPTLREALGDFAWYLDLVLCRTDDGLEVLGPPQRSYVRSNWKCPAEQGSVDGYHVVGLHRSLFELGFLGATNSPQAWALISVDISANGGGLRCMDTRDVYGSGFKTDAEKLQAAPPIGMTADMVDQLNNNLTEDQIKVITSYPPAVGQAFPSFEFLLVPGALEDGRVAPFLALHTWGPKGPDAFEIWTWTLVEKGVPEEMKEAALRASIRNFGTSGTTEVDDGEAWPAQQRSARGAMGRRSTFKYHAFTGHNPPEGWTGPGQVHDGFSRDDGQWGWWQRYFDVMLGRVS
jgi:phenylpropionate dioxygenase-like ring-hydroxylating dioxygenase large terminal subunit